MKRYLLVAFLTILSLSGIGQIGEAPVGRFHYQYQNKEQIREQIQNDNEAQVQSSLEKLELKEADEQRIVSHEHVSHVCFKQLEDTIVVTYDLNRRSEVYLLVSVDDGRTYTDTMKVSGSVNCVVPKGKNHAIYWHAFSDLGYGDYPEIWFKFVVEKEHFPKTTFITLNGACTNYYYPSLGFTYGQMKDFGWFVSVMSGFNYAGLAPDFVSESYGLVEGVLPFYKDESACTVLSVMGGGIFRVNHILSLKAGVGYGNRSLSWKTLDDRWVRIERYSAKGMDVSAGMMFNIGRFLLSVDAVTTDFSIFEGRIGLGYCFENCKKTIGK